MAIPSKKRKLAEVEATKNTPLSNGETLARLSKSPCESIGKMILKSVPKATAAELHVIQSLLAPLLGDELVEQHHCVRCHTEYTEASNHASACTFEHEYSEGRSRFPCCGEDVEYDERGREDREQGYCFEGHHTTDPEEVEYYGLDDEWSNQNIQTCEDNGCPSASEEEDSDLDSDSGTYPSS